MLRYNLSQVVCACMRGDSALLLLSRMLSIRDAARNYKSCK
jgi:hypothetical protein